MHLLHEPIEVDTAPLQRRQGRMEQVHQECFTATYATVVAEVPTEIALLTVSDAVMRMDLADQPVLMFRNSASGELNVVYRRSDGHVGWIDPGQ